MNKIFLFYLIFIKSTVFAFLDVEFLPDEIQTLWQTDLEKKVSNNSDIVIESEQIVLKDYPHAFNPSLVQGKQGLILAFRYCPDIKKDRNSKIGVVLLSDDLIPIGEPQILRVSLNPSHQEDPRLVRCKDKIFVVYNDCPDDKRRDMYLAELHCEEGKFFLGDPIKLYHQGKYSTQMCQKNWVPFEFDGLLLLAYSLNPHEILLPDLESGKCETICLTRGTLDWQWGQLRGGTPAIQWGGEYLAFFHSSKKASTMASEGKMVSHYFAGAYTFSTSPPFKVTKISSVPIIGEEFYTPGEIKKRVVFPGGFVVRDKNILMAFGKNDREIWIAVLDQEKLKRSLVSVE